MDESFGGLPINPLQMATPLRKCGLGGNFLEKPYVDVSRREKQTTAHFSRKMGYNQTWHLLRFHTGVYLTPRRIRKYRRILGPSAADTWASPDSTLGELGRDWMVQAQQKAAVKSSLEEA